VVLEPDDGSLGPLLRVADDRLAPGAGYGLHAHSAVDVVAVVLAGSLRHRWAAEPVLAAGDVAVLRAGTGLDHDEVAGDEGARVLQCYLRSAAPGAEPEHEMHRAAAGWLALGRTDARLWLAQVAAGVRIDPPTGLLLVAGSHGVDRREPGPVEEEEPVTVLVWQLATDRPHWAAD
jgi:redox-sensitive bicupin YhaK (pirin superfamily)